MKQLLFLLLFPSLALAQYQGNANQKITLGEQTTADGLVYRGVANDTNVITPFSDTSAYIILDTVNNKFYHYNRTTTFWALAGGGGDSGGVTSFSAGTTGLTPSTATTGAVTLGGTLAVANGGTGSATQNFVDLTTTQSSIGGAKTFTSAVTGARFNPTSSTVTGTGMYLPAANTLALSTDGAKRLEISSTGTTTFTISSGVYTALNATSPNASVYYRLTPTGGDAYLFGAGVQQTDDFGIYNLTRDKQYLTILGGASGGFVGIDLNTPTEKLDVNGNARIRGLANAGNPVNVQVDVNGVLVRTSSIDIKEDVQSLPYGLNEVMLLQPSKFSYIDKYKYGEGYDIGFIAQDVNNVIPEAVGTGIESDIFMDSVKLIPVLTKAIQEQQTLIKALEQRIINLENK